MPLLCTKKNLSLINFTFIKFKFDNLLKILKYFFLVINIEMFFYLIKEIFKFF